MGSRTNSSERFGFQRHPTSSTEPSPLSSDVPLLDSMASSSIPSTSARYLSYEARLPLHSNPSSRALLETIVRKKSNLSVSVDVTTKKELLDIVEAVGEFVVCVKVRYLPCCAR